MENLGGCLADVGIGPFSPEHSAEFKRLMEEKLKVIDDRIQRLDNVREKLNEAIAKIDELMIPMKAQEKGLLSVIVGMEGTPNDKCVSARLRAEDALRFVRESEIPY